MEFILVQVKDEPTANAAVLINGELNGSTGKLITLGTPGWIFVSVDLPGAQQRNVNVKNTTASHPMTIVIDLSGKLTS
jgi:hypothetical protein